MPVYFFDLHSAQRQLLDDEGTELPGALAARDEALAAVRDLLRPAQSTTPARWAGWSLRVRDEQGTPLMRLPIGPSPMGSTRDATPPMLVSAQPADRELHQRQGEEPPGQPSTGAPGRSGRERSAERDRSVMLLARCRDLLKALAQEVLAAKQEIGRSRQIVLRARGADGPAATDLAPIARGSACRNPPFLVLVPGIR